MKDTLRKKFILTITIVCQFYRQIFSPLCLPDKSTMPRSKRRHKSASSKKPPTSSLEVDEPEWVTGVTGEPQSLEAETSPTSTMETPSLETTDAKTEVPACSKDADLEDKETEGQFYFILASNAEQGSC